MQFLLEIQFLFSSGELEINQRFSFSAASTVVFSFPVRILSTELMNWLWSLCRMGRMEWVTLLVHYKKEGSMCIRFSFCSFTIPESLMQLAKWELLYDISLFKNWLGQDKVMSGCRRALMRSYIYSFKTSSHLMKNKHQTRLSMLSRYANIHKAQKNPWIT